MTKQEEIREEIEDTLKVCGQNPLTATALAYDLLLTLHSQGVVLKVEDKDIPDYISGCVKNAKQFGFTRTEPLIETKKEG